VRSSLQIQLESTEQKDTIAKFELFELKKVHEELTTSLSTMRRQNTQLVGPVVEKLGKEVSYSVTELPPMPIGCKHAALPF
jgi:hypothetical protein